jgi:hypothetical protein
MGGNLLDTYSDYLLYNGGRTTAMGLSDLVEEEVSRDKITRFLSPELFDEKYSGRK